MRARTATVLLAAGVALLGPVSPATAKPSHRTVHYTVREDETLRDPCTDERVRIRGALRFTERDVQVETPHGTRWRFHRSIASPHLRGVGESGTVYKAWVSLREHIGAASGGHPATTTNWITVTALRAPGSSPDLVLRQQYHLTSKDGQTVVERWTKRATCTG
ncbi:MAG: hypothetical protein ACM3OO_06730 [Planctomycetaceae bacterium]